MSDLPERLRYVAAANTEASLCHPSLLTSAADEIELLRKVVFEACDVALVTVSDEPVYFACFDAYEDEIESARFTPEQAAAVRRALGKDPS